MHTSKSPGSEVLVKCETESKNCPCEYHLNRTFVKFCLLPRRLCVFIHTLTYTLNLFLCVCFEIYININEIIFYNLFLLLNNVLLMSFVVSTHRSSSCFLIAIRDSAVWMFNSLFIWVPFETLKLLETFLNYLHCCRMLQWTF